MIKVAGRSTISFLLLIVTFFYIQPEVGEAFNLAKDSQNNTNNQNTTEDSTPQPLKVENTDTKTITFNADSGDNKITDKSNSRSFKATAYCLKGRTATGGGVRRGIVAADPRVLPLGTKIYMDAGPYSGTYVVADTGGAIKGRILDVWVPNASEARKFGRRKVTVSVLGR